MPALNGRFNAGSTNSNSPPTGRSLAQTLNFGNIMAVVMGLLAVKERWDAYKDRQEDREYLRAQRDAPRLPTGSTDTLVNPPQYRDDPNAQEIGLEQAGHLRLPDEHDAPARNRRSRSRSCCVCFGIRCDIVFKALGIVLTLYLSYGIYKLIRWTITPSPTGLENMPKYSTSLGCSDAIYTHPDSRFAVGDGVSEMSLDLTGGAVGTVFITQADTPNILVEMDLRTDEEPLLQKVSASLSGNSSTQATVFSLVTPSSALSTDACMRFDITVYIPAGLHMLSLKSQSLVHIKYDDHASLAIKNLTFNLLSPLQNNLLLPHESVNSDRTTINMRGGYLVGSLAFVDTAEVSTHRGSATMNLKVTPLPATGSISDSTARLFTRSGSGRGDVIYVNPDGRIIASEHTSTGGDMYLTYKQAGYNGHVDVQAKSWTSSGLEGTMVGSPKQGSVKDLPWVGEKGGKDTMKVKSSGWVGLYF